MLSGTFGLRDKRLRQPALIRENSWLAFEKEVYQTGKILTLLLVPREKGFITLEMFGFRDSQLSCVDCSFKKFPPAFIFRKLFPLCCSFPHVFVYASSEVISILKAKKAG